MIIVLGCKVLLLVLTIPFLLLSIIYRPSYRIPSSCNSLRLRLAASRADLFELNNVVARNVERFCGNERFLNNIEVLGRSLDPS